MISIPNNIFIDTPSATFPLLAAYIDFGLCHTEPNFGATT